ncbi:unnamed protein product [Calicophoron daubneyi]|uniref:Amino acid transporter transmembrane domain-containing protein n=1 Tax=Calicophoron daubneyi TaxID=300641 RepID=A0AAV2U2Q7_CALDB
MMRRNVRSTADYVSLLPSVVTLINSTVGVGALAMPYCFQQCGIVLTTLVLCATAATCVASCDLHVRLFLSHKGSSFELACFRYLGPYGKLAAELSIIGLMMGCIVGYDVSLADLGTGIVTQMSDTVPPYRLRFIMLSLLTVAITPLCLIPKVQGLVRLSAFSMLFYSLMVLHMSFMLGIPGLFRHLNTYKMNWWRPAGLVQCIPIFFFSFLCQTQLHTIYCSLHQPSVSAMQSIVRIVISIIGVAYGLFGFFGYVSFAHLGSIHGNVFLMYPSDMYSFFIQAGFLFTITVSIPLTLFPLRQSISSLLEPNRHLDVESGEERGVPIKRFRLMTITLLLICLSLSLTTDKIEVIIQLTSSLTGSLIGYILPAMATLSTFILYRAPQQRRLATYLMIVGLVLLIFGLYSVIRDPDPATAVYLNDNLPQVLSEEQAEHNPGNLDPSMPPKKALDNEFSDEEIARAPDIIKQQNPELRSVHVSEPVHAVGDLNEAKAVQTSNGGSSFLKKGAVDSPEVTTSRSLTPSTDVRGPEPDPPLDVQKREQSRPQNVSFLNRTDSYSDSPETILTKASLLHLELKNSQGRSTKIVSPMIQTDSRNATPSSEPQHHPNEVRTSNTTKKVSANTPKAMNKKAEHLTLVNTTVLSHYLNEGTHAFKNGVQRSTASVSALSESPQAALPEGMSRVVVMPAEPVESPSGEKVQKVAGEKPQGKPFVSVGSVPPEPKSSQKIQPVSDRPATDTLVARMPPKPEGNRKVIDHSHPKSSLPRTEVTVTMSSKLVPDLSTRASNVIAQDVAVPGDAAVRMPIEPKEHKDISAQDKPIPERFNRDTLNVAEMK